MNPIYFSTTKTGSVRKTNEDAILTCVTSDAALFLVADGVGGREHGEIVSGMLRDGFQRWWNDYFSVSTENMSFRQGVDAIKDELFRVNHEVIQRFGERTVGSTIVILFASEGKCAFFSSGDSRIYRIKNLELQQVTIDDVFENLPLERAAQYGAAASGKLVGAVGISQHLDFSVRTDILQNRDQFFLCSDGVYRYVSERQLKKRLVIESRLFSPERVVRAICKDVEENGSGDNYSMVLVKFC